MTTGELPGDRRGHSGGPVPDLGRRGRADPDRAPLPPLRLQLRCNVGATREEALQRAYDAGVVCVDEFLLHPDPYPSRQDWCRARVEGGGAAPGDKRPSLPMVLINHFPLLDAPTRVLRHPSSRSGAGPCARPIGTGAFAPPRSSTGTCTSRARPGTTACASRRSRLATRASGATATAATRRGGSCRAPVCLSGSCRRACVVRRPGRRPRGGPHPEEEAMVERRSRSAGASSSPPAPAPATRWRGWARRGGRSSPGRKASRCGRAASSAASPTATATGHARSPARRS